MSVRSILLCLVVSAFLVYCEPNGPPPPIVTTISGRVVDAITNDPVASATVSNDQNAEQVFTNGQGMYTVRVDVEVGKQYRMTVTKDGYAQNIVTILAKEGEERIADIPLTPSNPKLGVSPDSLRFEAMDNQKTLTVRNVGGGTLIWEMTAGEAWLRVEPASGRLDRGASSAVTVKVDREEVDASGTYSSDVTFTSRKAGDKTVPVMMVVEREEEPVLSVSPAALVFVLESDSRVVTVSNTGHGLLVWHVAVSDTWLSVSPDTGSVSGGLSQYPTVTVTREGLEPGREYTGSVQVLSEVAGSRSVSVTMSAPNPVIQVSTRDLNFGTERTELSVTISNIGTGTLTWAVSIPGEISWLTVEPGEGFSTVASSSSVLFSATRNKQEPGRYTGQVVLTSNSSAESRIELTVVMEVIPREGAGVIIVVPWPESE